MDFRWWIIGFVCGLWLLLTGRLKDWALLPVLTALGPLVVVFYLAALIDGAIRKGEA